MSVVYLKRMGGNGGMLLAFVLVVLACMSCGCSTTVTSADPKYPEYEKWWTGSSPSGAPVCMWRQAE